MAIAFARARYIGRASGGSAVRSAAYNAREGIRDERTGELYYFAHRDAPEHHEVLLPAGASAELRDAKVLWNAAEGAENRKNSQVARELVLALPANAEVTNEDRIELARSFAQEHFVRHGLAVQVNVHAPHSGDADAERANWHAHLLVTTRRVEGDHLSAKKARDLDPEVKRLGGRAAVTDGEAWGALWRDHQNRHFAEHGYEVRVDAAGSVAQQHVGPVRMRAPDAEANAKAEEVRRANAEAARDPDKVLAVLTRNNATFSERDLDRYLSKHISDEAEHLAVKGNVWGHADIVALYDRETGEAVGRWTTGTVRAQEGAALAEAGEVASGHRGRVSGRAARDALEGRALRPDQLEAFKHAIGEGGLKIVEGRAGTGKSFTLSAIRDAHTEAGYEVVGLAPTNAVAQDLGKDGFARAATVHSELFRIKNGRVTWSAKTLVVVDEAAMLDARITGELMTEARRAGAKVVLAGDDRQLASIERGGLFSELKARHGSAEITEVTRQKVDWQRQAARDMSEGRVEEAVRAFARNKAITWTERQDEARAALVGRWKQDTEATPNASRFVFAYTNKDVDALNNELRQVRRERGELGPDHAMATKHGEALFAVGDRVQFTDNLKGARIYNGNAGTITGIEADTGVVRAKLDGASNGEGREVVWSASEFDGFRHGYAGTIYKGQGKTLDHTYLLHTHHWRQSSAYVALTRQRESAQIFAATETARDLGQLARQMTRGEVKSASVAWATRDELPATLRTAAEVNVRREEVMEADAPKREIQDRPRYERADATARPAATADTRNSTDWLIPPRVSADGSDSMGRGLDRASVAFAVASDRAVLREREALGSYLDGTYRDPDAAKARLDDLVGREGYTSGSERVAADPRTLGEFRGRTGLLAGRTAREERATADQVWGAIAPAVRRIGEAEAKAELGYRSSVEAQLAADATGIPRLSERAQVRVDATGAAENQAGRAEAWRAAQADETVARELAGFTAAVEKRLGEEGVRAMLRAQQAGAKPFEGGPTVAPEQREAVAEVGRATSAIKSGQGATERQAEAEQLSLRTSQGKRMKM